MRSFLVISMNVKKVYIPIYAIDLDGCLSNRYLLPLDL